jgi:hypothetical protein
LLHNRYKDEKLIMLKKIKSGLGKKLLLFIAVLFTLQLSVPLATPQVYAAADNDAFSKAKQHARTNLYGFMQCMTILKTKSGLASVRWTTEEANNFDLWDDEQVSVGFELDGEDGTRTCKEVARRFFQHEASAGADGRLVPTPLKTPLSSKTAFLEALLEPYDESRYTLRDGAKEELLDELSKLASTLHHGDRTIGPDERVRRAVVNVRECIETIPTSGLSDPGRNKVKIGDKNYIYKDGKDPNTNIPVGYDFSRNGMSCKDLVSIVDRNNGFEKFADAKSGDAATGEGEGGGGDGKPDCDTSWDSPPSWIMCPLIDLGVDMTDNVFQSIIVPMLENVPVTANPKEGVYIAWQQFRLIANVLLVGSLLIIVYSQARGGK